MEAADLTIITASIPGREDLLARNIQSVHAQTIRPNCHLIRAHSFDETGPEISYNILAKTAQTSWLSVLDDDNFLLANHVETIRPYFDKADVIYTWDGGNSRPRWDMNTWDQERVIAGFMDINVVDQSCAIRRSKWLEIGGMRGERQGRIGCPDHHLFLRLALAGARFVCVPVETWVYQVAPPSSP